MADTDYDEDQPPGPRKRNWVFESTTYGGAITKTYQTNDDLTVEVRINADSDALATNIAEMCDHIDSWLE